MKFSEVYVAYEGQENYLKAWKLWMDLCWKHQVPASCGNSGRSLRSQLQEAKKLDCRFALILGDDAGRVTVRSLSDEGERFEVTMEELPTALNDYLNTLLGGNREKETAQA